MPLLPRDGSAGAYGRRLDKYRHAQETLLLAKQYPLVGQSLLKIVHEHIKTDRLF